VAGRELYVGVLGNERIRTLTPWEFIFGELKPGRAAIATRKAKWDRAYQKRHGITSGKAEAFRPASRSAWTGSRGASTARCT
jgi:D-alanine-D-alanine ligase